MILVDSGVWIDFFNGVPSRETDRLAELLRRSQVVLGDLILTEVLQGFSSDRDYRLALRALAPLPLIRVVDREAAVLAAEHYRSLRRLGVTVRKTIDCLIATRCILNRLPLLYGDRDFLPFVEHLGLQNAMAD